MSKALVVGLMVVAVVVVAAGLVGLGSASGSPAASSLTLTAVLDVKATHATDVAPKGPSAGDTHVYSATLRRGGRVVGRLEGVTTAADPLYEGDVSTQYLVLTDGTVAIVGGGQSGAPGVGRPDSKIFDAIVGGTGRYAGASGWITAEDVNDTTELMTLHFTR
jgi:hypothetical protein